MYIDVPVGFRNSPVSDRPRTSSSFMSQCNFYVYYEIDDDEVPTALGLEDYGSNEEGGWVLLEATTIVAPAEV